MKHLHAAYSLVTPMFLGGADPKAAEVGFRLPSFKGALRFWWRALAWSEVVEEAGDVAPALRLLHRRESDLFGSAAGEDTRGGQSRVLLSAHWKPGRTVPAGEVRAPAAGSPEDGLAYLMGQGLRGRRAVDGGELQVFVTFRPGTGEEGRQGVERALLLLGLLGGLGSRARRGFGSLAMESLEGHRLLDLAVPRTLDDLRETLAGLTRVPTRNRPPYSAFSAQSRIDLSLVGPSSDHVQGTVGRQMREFRETLADDTRRARDAADGKRPDQPPERSIFGLPLQFYFKADGARVFVTPATRREEKVDRRGSPLLIHIHRFQGEPDARRYAAVQTLLPAQFLPKGKGVRVQGKRGHRENHFDFPEFDPTEALIRQYLDDFHGRVPVLS